MIKIVGAPAYLKHLDAELFWLRAGGFPTKRWGPSAPRD